MLSGLPMEVQSLIEIPSLPLDYLELLFRDFVDPLGCRMDVLQLVSQYKSLLFKPI